ncbi:hypothetical protein SDC9_140832 [bioreactor metagenome]|uniref:Uncharacterized protein n=1 Tax=bioreactor metagenome TaxID=1076179 RepID=A0A645DW08_9ZZZZ
MLPQLVQLRIPGCGLDLRPLFPALENRGILHYFIVVQKQRRRFARFGHDQRITRRGGAHPVAVRKIIVQIVAERTDPDRPFAIFHDPRIPQKRAFRIGHEFQRPGAGKRFFKDQPDSAIFGIVSVQPGRNQFAALPDQNFFAAAAFDHHIWRQHRVRRDQKAGHLQIALVRQQRRGILIVKGVASRTINPRDFRRIAALVITQHIMHIDQSRRQRPVDRPAQRHRRFRPNRFGSGVRRRQHHGRKTGRHCQNTPQAVHLHHISPYFGVIAPKN